MYFPTVSLDGTVHLPLLWAKASKYPTSQNAQLTSKWCANWKPEMCQTQCSGTCLEFRAADVVK